jgi:D-beta-D-heptose 7-phosphate kinase/D-beta-D-heptose 1-phosphate adenosyltransferase
MKVNQCRRVKGLTSVQDKIKTLEQLKETVRNLKQAGKTVVFTNGCYDLIHVGHVRLLQQAKRLGDSLIVAINSDSSVRTLKGNNKPLVPQEERAEVLASLEAVDFVVIFNELDPLRVITELQPDVLVKGGDWTVDTIIGRDVVEQAGGTVISLPFVEGVSTTSIIERILKSHSA